MKAVHAFVALLMALGLIAHAETNIRFAPDIEKSAGAEDLVALRAGLEKTVRPRLMAATASSKTPGTTVTATGDLGYVRGRGSLYFYFDVPSSLKSVTSARVSMNSYDVDCPSATEHDKVYFNGTYIGRLQGYDDGWEINTFAVPASSVKIGQSNTMRIDVDVGGEGWVTGSKEVVLYLNGEEGEIGLSATSGLKDRVYLSWTANFSGTTFNVYRGSTPESLAIYQEGLTEMTFSDTSVTLGETYYYQVMSRTGISSGIVEGRCQDGSITLLATTAYYHEIRLMWNPDNCEGPYTIYRGSRVDDLAPLAYGVNDMSYTDTKVTGGETYYYRVVAANGIVSDVVKGASKRAEIKLKATNYRNDGIHLLWTCPVEGLGYCVSRSTTENGPFETLTKDKFGRDQFLLRDDYFDGDVVPGCDYYYRIESSIGVISDVVSGRLDETYRGPKFTFELEGAVKPKRFGLNSEKDVLVAGSNVFCHVKFQDLGENCVIHGFTLSGYNVCSKVGKKEDHRVRVDLTDAHDSFYFGPGNYAHGILVSDSRTQDGRLDFFARLNSKAGLHGLYEWSLSCDYEMNGIKNSMTVNGHDRNVYFAKHKRDAGIEENWFAYWKVDGACPDLKDERVHYVLNNEDYGSWNPETGRIAICPRAAWDMDKPFTVSNGTIRTSFGSWPDGRWVYGIYQVQDTLVHEMQHAKTSERYDQQIARGKRDSDKGSGQRGCYISIDKEQAQLGFCSVEGRINEVERCDFIVDDDELEPWRWLDGGLNVSGLKIDEVDTFGMQHYFHYWAYAGYGDDEYVARVAGKKGMTRADATRDWAYPGELSGDMPPEATRMVHSSLMSSSKVLAAEMSADGGADDGIVHITVLGMESRKLTSGDVVTGLEYEIGLKTDSPARLLLKGILIDGAGNEVICSSSIFDNHSEAAVFTFDAKKIFESGYSGPFTLSRVDILVKEHSSTEVIGSLYDFKVPAFDVRREELDRSAGSIVKVKGLMRERDDLTATLVTEFNIGCDCEAVAEISDTNGNYVASCRCEYAMVKGTNEVMLTFSGAEIYASAHDGPYVLGSVQLWRGDEMIDAATDLVTTEVAYRYEDFKPSNSVVTVDRGSFAFAALTMQGAGDGLFSGLKFSFDAKNSTEKILCYRISALLVGADAVSVTMRDGKYVYLEPGVNHLEVDFQASAIAVKGIDGPYSIREVEMNAVDKGGNSFIFRPDAKTPAYKASDFAAASVAFSGETARVERADDSLVVAFDYETTRGCTVVAAATLVDTNGNFVARAYSTNVVRHASSQTARLEFSWQDLSKDNVGGPYRVAYFSLTPLGTGEAPLVSDSLEIRDVDWLTPTAQPSVEIPEGVDWDALYTWDITNGTAVAKSYRGADAHDVVVVPSEHDGLPVTRIEKFCFFNNLTVKAVVVSEGISTIGPNAFRWCESLKTVVLPDSVESIENRCFSHCTSLERVYLPPALQEIGEDAFVGDVSLEALWIPQGVLNIPDAMCWMCSNLVMVALPPVVTNVENAVFKACPKLRSARLPSGFKVLPSEMFRDSVLLESLDLPDTLEAIGNYSVLTNDTLTEIVIPPEVTNIGTGAFLHCTAVTNFIFRGPPPEVGAWVFPKNVPARYPLTYREAWEAVIVNGLWNGLQMYSESMPPRSRTDIDEIVDESTFEGGEWSFSSDGTRSDQCLRSARIGNGQHTDMAVVLTGGGVVTFDWRTSCEGASANGSLRDHAEFLVDGAVVAVRDGESVWSRVSFELEGEGEHTVTWRYAKDGSGSAGQDCVWVSDVKFESISDEETSDELLDESEYNWFYEDVPVSVEKDAPFEYSPRVTPEDTTSQVDFLVELGGWLWADVLKENTDDIQAAVVGVDDAKSLKYAVLTADGWVMVGNESIVLDESVPVKVSLVFDYASSPSTFKCMISGHTLTNAAGVSTFVCKEQKTSVSKVIARTNNRVSLEAWAGKYEVANSDVQEVAAGTETELAANLDTFSNETFRVSGGGTLVIPGDKIPADGVNRKLHVDANSAVTFDLSGIDPISTVTRLFNGVGNSFAIGENMKLIVPGEGEDRVSKLFVKDGNLEARVAERPDVGDEETPDGSFRVNVDGDTSTAAMSVGNAVEGFWYGLLTTDLLTSDFLLDRDSVRQCPSTGPLKLESSANANSHSGFYRVSVSADKPD